MIVVSGLAVVSNVLQVHVLNLSINLAHACVAALVFSTGGKFRPVSIFTQLHALTLVACSYALLT